MRTAVIGSGTFGTACASALAGNCDEVWLWGRDPELVQAIAARHENTAYLAGIALPPNLRATVDLQEALTGAELVVAATPSHAAREVMLRAAPYVPTHVPVVTVTKGIENETLKT